MIILIILSIFANLILIWIVYNLFRQNQQLEAHIHNFNKIEDDAEKFYSVLLKLLVQTASEMQRIDQRGSFSGDDEVGFAFRVISSSIESCKQAVERLRDTPPESQGQ